MNTCRIGIITGTGINEVSGLNVHRYSVIETPYGDAKVALGSLANVQVIWIRRHGAGHYLAPAGINYRSNLLALLYLGVQKVLATNAVGAIMPTVHAGEICLLADLLGRPHGGAQSFYRSTVVHVDFSSPYSLELQNALRAAASSLNISIIDATYGATPGPRFETAAEIEALRRAGAGVVGMTGDLEASLARELSLEYAALGIVSNSAAGYAVHVSTRQIATVIANRVPAVSAILAAAAARICE